jgi:DNA-directed RNA polymerase subunit RPC12/RpoP
MVVRCPYCDSFNRIDHTNPIYKCVACELNVANPVANGDSRYREKQEKTIFWVVFVAIVIIILAIFS